MHLQQILQRLGYSSNETTVYLTLLKLGESNMADISRQSGLPRTSCYYILDKLQTHGLVSTYEKRRRPYWVAADPGALETHLSEQAQLAQKLIPALKALQPKGIDEPMTRFYDGHQGIKDIFTDILSERKDILTLGPLDKAIAALGEDHRHFLEQRRISHLSARYITNKTPASITMQGRDAQENRLTRFLPAGTEIESLSCIYGDKLAVISINQKKPMGIIISYADVAKTQRVMFEALWDECA
jgi:sugar-specific transcriptional regulator TrmB